MSARAWHRRLGLVLIVFLALHLGGHAALLISFDLHKAWLEKLRHLYRPHTVEFLLLAILGAQLLLGLRQVIRQGWPRRGWAWAQALSGLYLIFFLAQHVPAVLMARNAVPPVETDAQFAAALVQMPGISWYGAVYYTLAVTAAFTHVAAWQSRRFPALARLIPFVGAAYGAALVAGMAGLLHPAPVSQAHFDHLAHMLPGFLTD